MNELLLLWLSLSISGSLVFLVLILLKPLIKRFSKTWQYYLWLLVILRLLIPFSPDTSIVGTLFQQVEAHFATQPAPAAVPLETAGPGLTGKHLNPDSQVNSPEVLPSAFTDPSLAENHLWGALWLTVAAVLLMSRIYGYRQFLRAVKTESKVIVDGAVPAALRSECAAMGINNQIILSINALVRAPILVGMLKPMVILPDKAVPSSELTLIFRHELTHYRRMDFVYKWLTEITVCLHWFNPMVYWVRQQINQSCELSCDESVIRRLDDGERQRYGETLLNAVTASDRRKSGIGSLYLNEDGRLLQERLYGIMKYQRKPKYIFFIAVVLTTVLLCGTVYAGAYTTAAVQNTSDSAVPAPIRISKKDLPPGGKISLGSQQLFSGTTCQASLSWIGKDPLTILYTSADDAEKSLTIANGEVTTFTIDGDDSYIIAVKNNNTRTVKNINGTIRFVGTPPLKDKNLTLQTDAAAWQTVVYERVEMRRYEGQDGFPYAHDIRTNHTDKTIAGTERAMLAYDKEGNPLIIDWQSLDSSQKPSYYFLYDWDDTRIIPGSTDDVHGGWTLNVDGTDKNVQKIAYILYCDKKITFSDGTVWENPEFKSWLDTYKGKKTDVNVLNTYYPYQQKIAPTAADGSPTKNDPPGADGSTKKL